MVMSSFICLELQVLRRQRPAYQKLARVIRPVAAVAMRNSTQTSSPGEMPRVNEKQEAWLERSYYWWRLYRSLTRALSPLSRVYLWNAFAS